MLPNWRVRRNFLAGLILGIAATIAAQGLRLKAMDEKNSARTKLSDHCLQQVWPYLDDECLTRAPERQARVTPTPSTRVSQQSAPPTATTPNSTPAATLPAWLPDERPQMARSSRTREASADGDTALVRVYQGGHLTEYRVQRSVR